MKCSQCGASPADGVTTLLRQNEKGRVGTWMCEQCNRKDVNPIVAGAVASIQRLRDNAAGHLPH